jgi:hypothetical protein
MFGLLKPKKKIPVYTIDYVSIYDLSKEFQEYFNEFAQKCEIHHDTYYPWDYSESLAVMPKIVGQNKFKFMNDELISQGICLEDIIYIHYE